MTAERTPRPAEGGEGSGSWRRRLGRRVHAVYRRHERYTPPLFFFGGVLWDVSTLDRIDAWEDNLLLLAYLVLLGVLIVVAILEAYDRLERAWLRRYSEWYPEAIQFFLGALFSAYVIFYFQSASLTHTSYFFLLLVVLLVANEFIHRRLFNLYLLVALYFLAAFSFFIFFVPVLARRMSFQMFLLGGSLSVLLVGAMLFYLEASAVFERRRQLYAALALVMGLFGLLNLFYLLDWIPPVPLAMRYGDVFHYVEQEGGDYVLHAEPQPWYAPLRPGPQPLHYTPGDPVYCFAAVFAPTALTKEVYHAWHYYDETREAWVPTDRIAYRVTGGRDNGYRGYTYKRNVHFGRWRVDVRTADDHTLGRIRFDVVPATDSLALETRVYR